MDDQTANTIKRDFMIWSGGFPPESEHQIFAYIETAKSADFDDEETRSLLREWMNEDAPTHPDD